MTQQDKKKGNKACTDREGRNKTWFTDDMCAQQNRNLKELIIKSMVLARYHVTLRQLPSCVAGMNAETLKKNKVSH